MTEEQYTELAQLWHEYMMLGAPTRDIGLSQEGIALNFSEWIDSNDEEESLYGLDEIIAFFREKERREGTAVPVEYQE